MLDDVAAAISEEFELLLSPAVRACELEDQDVEVALKLGRRQPGNLVLLPDLDATREREFQGLTVEVSPIAEGPQGVLIDLITRDHPEDQPGTIAVLQDRAVNHAE